MSLYDEVQDLHESVADAFRSLTEIHDSLTGIYDSLTGIHDNLTGIYDSLTEIDESGTSNAEDHITFFRDIRELKYSIWELQRKQRSNTMDLFQIQEAIVGYINRHPKKLPELVHSLSTLISRVEKRLEKRPKLIDLIETENIEAMRELTEWELDWVFVEINLRITSATDDPEKANRLKEMRNDLVRLMKEKREK